MAAIKRGEWIQAKRFRVTKKNGRTVMIEVQRTVKRKTRTNTRKRTQAEKDAAEKRRNELRVMRAYRKEADKDARKAQRQRRYPGW